MKMYIRPPRNKNGYYLYVFLDPRKPGVYTYENYVFDHEPFYVGKGSGPRIKEHFRLSQFDSNSYRANKIRSIRSMGLEPIKSIMLDGKGESYVLEEERKLIGLIGRRPTGPLTNLCAGGEAGPSGYKHTEEARLRMRRARIGKKLTEEHRRKIGLANRGKKPWLGKHHTEEFKKALAERNKGNKWGKGGLSNSKEYAIRFPDGTTHTVKGLVNFCKTAEGNPTHGSLHNGSCSKGYYAITLEKFRKVGEDWTKALAVIQEKVDHLNDLRRLRKLRERDCNE
jgi:hypothetical protein